MRGGFLNSKRRAKEKRSAKTEIVIDVWFSLTL